MAERLKEAGYNGPALWGYCAESKDAYTVFESREWGYKIEIKAPTATELIPKGYHLSHMSTREGGSVWAAFFDDKGGHCGFNENPHDAAALAWLWEKEKGQ